jgi:hypothetical protein
MGIFMQRTYLALKVILLNLLLVLPIVPIIAQPIQISPNTHLQADYQMSVENSTAWPGKTNHVIQINGYWSNDIKEYSIKIYYNKTNIQITNIILTGCVGENPSSFLWENNLTAGFFKATVQKTQGISNGSGSLFVILVNISMSASIGKTILDVNDGPSTYFVTTDNTAYAPRTFDGYINIGNWNRPPETPVIHGPVVGGSEVELNFSAVTTDFESDQIYYRWDWGDGNISGWTGPFNSNETMNAHHNWLFDGSYTIKVKAKDNGNESNWATHSIVIARQLWFNNIHPGYIYVNFLTFNRSFIYIGVLGNLGVTVVISTSSLFVRVNTSEYVSSVRFEAMNQFSGDSVIFQDWNHTRSFGCNLNVSLGIYQLSATAYDTDGNMVDRAEIPYVIFLGVGSQGGMNYR